MFVKKNAFVATLAMLVLVPTAAQAAGGKWFVNGKALTPAERSVLAETAKVQKAFTITVAPGLVVTCPTLKVVGGYIEGPEKGGASRLVFGGCSTNSGICRLEGERLETTALSLLASSGARPEDIATLKPVSGQTFATVHLIGEECALGSPLTIHGKLTIKLPHGQEELERQSTVINSTGELNDGFGVAVAGEASLALSSLAHFSFHE